MSDNLNITQLSSSQNNKETTINDKDGELDAAITEVVTKTVNSSNAATLTQAELQRAVLLQVDADGGDPPSGAITVTVGAAFKRGIFAIFNNTAQDVTVEVSGQFATPPTVPAGEVNLATLGGANVRPASATGGGGGGTTNTFNGPVNQIMGLFKGARVTKSSSQSLTAATNNPITFDTEAFDSDAFHDNAVNNTRLTVPPGFGITKVRVTANADLDTPSTGDVQAYVAKNGEAFPGRGGEALQAFTGSELLSIDTGVVDVVAGDYFEFFINPQNTGQIDATTGSNFSIEVVEAENDIQQLTVASSRPFRGVLASKSANQALSAAFPGDAVTFDGEQYDTDAFHDNSTNPSRMTVPAAEGIKKVRLSANAVFTASANDKFVGILKNGSEFVGSAQSLDTASGANKERLNVSTPAVDVADGDFFEVFAWAGGTGTVEGGAGADETWFAMEVVEDAANSGNTFNQNWAVPWRGARTNKTAGQSITTGSFTAVNWDGEDVDTDGIWGAGNPTRLTVPAGITKAAVAWAIDVTSFDGGSGEWGVGIIQHRDSGGTLIATLARSQGLADLNADQRIGTVIGTGTVDVSEGDYFEALWFAGQTGQTINNSDLSWFEMEIKEVSDAAKRPYDLAAFVAGTPTGSSLVYQFVADRAFTLRSGLGNSQGFAGTTDAGAQSFQLQRNGAGIGTVDFAAATATATFTFASDVTFSIGDRLQIVAPASPGTLADVSITLEATLP